MSDDKQAGSTMPAAGDVTQPATETGKAEAWRFQRPPWLTLPTVESTSNSMRAVVVNLVLLAVILMAAPLIASQAARDQILLEPISVPEGLQVTGLTPEVAANRLNDGLLQIIRDADTEKSSINPIPEGQQTSFDIPESGISVDALVSYARQFFNLHETVIGGEFRCGDAACTPALVSLRLRINGRERNVVDLPPMRRSTEAEYFRQAGLQVMSYLDPFTALAAEVNFHPSNAATIARQLIAAGHEDAKWAHNVLGSVRRSDGKFDEALAEYQAALAIDPRFAPALRNMAITLAESGRNDEAEAYLERLATLESDDPIEAEVRGDIARARGNIDAARDAYILASERDPLDGRYLGKAAFMLNSEGRTEEAVELAWAAFQVAPDHPIPIGFLGAHYGGLGDYDELERLYRDAAEYSPEDEGLQALHGNLLITLGKYEQALERLDQALLINDGVISYRIDKADALRKLGRFDDALIELDLAGQRDPSNADVVYTRGMTLAALGRNDEAAEAYRKFVLMEPEGIEADMARLFLQSQEPQAETPVAEPVADISEPPEDPAAN